MGLSRAVGGEYLFSFNFTNGVNVQVGGHVPYQAAPEARLQAQPVAGLVVPQRAQEERGGDAGVGGQRDGELQGVDQCRVPGMG